MLKQKKVLYHRVTRFIVFIRLYRLLSSKGSSSQHLPIAENLLFQLTSLKLRWLFPTFDTSSTLDRKSIVIIREFGSGERVGEAEQWPNSDRAEQEERHMATVIVFTHQLSMPISWKSILCHKYANYHLIVSFCNSKLSAFLMSSSFPSRLHLTTKKSRPRFNHYWKSRLWLAQYLTIQNKPQWRNLVTSFPSCHWTLV